ncbi:MAG: TipAS antibiotic-recognition domain-containing protein [Bifidobacteriaceae bacterium]|jgi:DNA-binding transcriptional MerR regulator|nr:TipAS antibiotic-recognition domain-containing protein [Bifidobacteriaceae bacterium]
MTWSIHEVANMAGTTSRTLRHYDAIGLLRPTSVGHNGYRYYDDAALRRLQRILLLRDLGLSLTDIASILARQTDEYEALQTHLDFLEREQQRLERQVASVHFAMDSLQQSTTSQNKERKMEKLFDGFDHTQYKEEVEQRWGKESYASSDRWYRSLSADERAEWKNLITQLNADWTQAAHQHLVSPTPETAPTSKAAQSIARRHVEWLAQLQRDAHVVGDGSFCDYVRSLAQMYPQDERFAANYGGAEGATFVREALLHFMDEHEKEYSGQ